MHVATIYDHVFSIELYMLKKASCVTVCHDRLSSYRAVARDIVKISGKLKKHDFTVLKKKIKH